MKKTSTLLLLLGAIFLVNDSVVIRADNITFTSGLTWYQTGPSATPYHIWVAGDYWDQSFATSLSQANNFDFDLTYDDNSLAPAQTLKMEVLVNGSLLGNFAISSGQTSSVLSFPNAADFAGPTFDIRLEAVNTIASGEGSVSLNTAGLSTGSISVVPEPASMGLFVGGLAGLAGLVGAIRRKFRN